MIAFYGIIFAIFIGLGIFELREHPASAIHHFLVGLYFFLILFAVKGNPFSKRVHLGLGVAFVADAGLQLYMGDILGTFISMMFAYLSYIDGKRFGA